MDKMPSLIPKKNGKKKWILNYVLFEKNSKPKIIVKAATIESIDKVLNNIKEIYVSVSQLVEFTRYC